MGDIDRGRGSDRAPWELPHERLIDRIMITALLLCGMFLVGLAVTGFVAVLFEVGLVWSVPIVIGVYCLVRLAWAIAGEEVER